MASLVELRSVRVALAALVAFVVTLVPATIASASGPSYYLAVQSAEVDFVEFTVSGNNVVGVIYVDTLAGSLPSLYVESQSETLRGTDNGGQLTLFLGGSDSPVFASEKGASLSLQVPQSGGTLSTATLSQSSVAAYDRVLSQWHQRISTANSAAAAKAQRAAQAAAHIQQLLDQLNATIQQVDNDLSVMASPGNLGDDEGTLGDDLSTVEDDLSTVEDDNSTFTDDADNGTNPCGDIRSAYGDAHTVYTDGQAMVSDAKSGVGGDLQAELAAMASAPGDWAAYWRAQHALPRYEPNSPIPPLKVALASGHGVVNAAVSQVNGDIGQANGNVAQAYRMVNAANNANHCGPPKVTPALGHVTPALLGA